MSALINYLTFLKASIAFLAVVSVVAATTFFVYRLRFGGITAEVIQEISSNCDNGILTIKDGVLICETQREKKVSSTNNDTKIKKAGTSTLIKETQTIELNDLSISNDLTLDENSTISWAALTNYPSGCGSGQAVQSLGDTITCISVGGTSGSSLWSADGMTRYLEGFDNDLAIGGSGSDAPLFFDTDVERLTVSNMLVNKSATFNEHGGNNDFRIEGDSDSNLFFVDASLDSIGIGVTNPTAYLDIKASTTSRSALRIREGSTPSAPETGDIFVKDKSLHFVSSQDSRTVNLADGIITSSVTLANTTTETTIFTEEISLGELHAGQVVECNMFGNYSTANASDTFLIRFKVGGSTIETKASVAGNASIAPWQVKYIFTIRSSGASGTMVDYVSAIFDNVHDDKTRATVDSIDTTVADDFVATVQWDSADSSNTLTITQGWCEFLN